MKNYFTVYIYRLKATIMFYKIKKAGMTHSVIPALLNLIYHRQEHHL